MRDAYEHARDDSSASGLHARPGRGVWLSTGREGDATTYVHPPRPLRLRTERLGPGIVAAQRTAPAQNATKTLSF